MSNYKKIKVGVVGVGHWGPNIIRNFAEHDRVDLSYICDLSDLGHEKVARFIPKHCRRSNNAQEVFDSPEIDAVAIVTPPTTHFDLVKGALEAGKHVFCEKPLSTNSQECQELCQLAKNQGVHLMVGFTFLFNNAIIRIKELIKENRLGKIYYLTARRTHLGLIRPDVNVFWDLAPHDISIMNYFLDDFPKKVSAIGAKPLGRNLHDFGFLTLFYPSGIIGQVHLSWVDSNKVRQVEVVGSEARVIFDDLNELEPVRYFEKGVGVGDKVEVGFGEFRFLLRDGDIISPKIHMKEPLAKMIDSFIRTVMDETENCSDGNLGYGITRILAAAESSLESGGLIVEV